MGKRPQTKMSIEARAKQFMPFAAVSGLNEAIAKKEREHEEKIKQGKKNEDS